MSDQGQGKLFGATSGRVVLDAQHGMHAMVIQAVDGGVELTIGKAALRLTVGRAGALAAALMKAVQDAKRAA